jgi:hypothetical protein
MPGIWDGCVLMAMPSYFFIFNQRRRGGTDGSGSETLIKL